MMIVIGHRGAAGLAPENTLASVARALELGVDMVEVDVFAIEEQLVVIHDDTLERTTNGRGRVTDQTLACLRSLDAGGGQRIPLLHEVFDLVDGKAGINVELKGPRTAPAFASFARAAAAHGGWDWDRVLVSSFHRARLRDVRRRCPALRLGALVSRNAPEAVSFAARMKAYSLNLPQALVTPRLVGDGHARGLKVFVYTVNTLQELERVHAMNVDGIFTDYPDRIRGRATAALRERGGL